MSDLYELAVGDTFIEDCHPEIWKVLEFNSKGMLAEIVDDKGLGKKNTGRLGETAYWCGSGAYAPIVYRWPPPVFPSQGER